MSANTMSKRNKLRSGVSMLSLVLGGAWLAACGGESSDAALPDLGGNPAGGADPMKTGDGTDQVGDEPAGTDDDTNVGVDDGTGNPGTDPDTANNDGNDPDTGDGVSSPNVIDEPAISAAALSCDAPEVGSPVLRLLTRFEFTNTVNAVFPAIAGQWTSTLSVDLLSEAGFDNSASAQVGGQQAEHFLETAESIGDAVAGDALAQLLPCSTGTADRSCAQEFVATYGKRLFRRPLTTPESDRYLTLFDSALEKTDFPTAIKWVTAALVQSPNAVYRSELGTVANGGRTLTPYELATELAYTYTSSGPSDALLAKADSGDLGDLTAIATELLNSEAGKASLMRFFDGYIGYRFASTIEKTDATTAGLSYTQVKADMMTETQTFLAKVIIDGGGGVAELLTSRSTFPSSQLASYYGMPAPSADFSETPRTDGVGILAQGAFLASKAGPDASSPTRRGLFVTERLLCQEKPPLPDDVPDLMPVEPGTKTTRQRYEELHAGSGACASCHALFDPVGFAFEHYDEAGRYRADEDGLPINTEATITLQEVGTLSFADQEDLMTQLAANETVHECFSAYLSTFAFGTTEACLGSSQTEELASGAIGIVDAFAALAAEPHFSQRKAQ